MTDTTPNLDVRRTVLCAVADDDRLQDVVAAGRALALSGSFRVLFVHVAAPAVRLRTSPSVGPGAGAALADVSSPRSTIDDLRCEARRAGLALVTRAGIGEDEAIVTDGDPGIEIDRLAAEHDAALVVVGSHARGAIAGALVGSVSRRLALEGRRPVLVARSAAVPCAGGPVVCGIDLADDDEQAIRPAIHAAQLARLMDRRLVLVYVLTADHRLPAAAGALLAAPRILRPTQRQRERVDRLLDAVRLPEQPVESCVVEGDCAGTELDRFAADRGADLLVVGARRRGVVQRTLEGGVLRDLLRNGRQPLVIVPPA